MMKKYILLGLMAGVSISALLVLLYRKDLAGDEFHGYFDLPEDADELFGDAFRELPDRI